MAHQQQREFIEKIRRIFPDSFTTKNVLEIGSLDINGTIRDFFENCNYIGIDVAEGKGVDIVCQGQDYKGEDESFDTLCSAECFEHNPYWIETFTNMIRLCKTGGLIFFTCATTGRHEHGTDRTTPDDSPLTVSKGWNYYKNLSSTDFLEHFKIDDIFYVSMFMTNTESCDLYFFGIKNWFSFYGNYVILNYKEDYKR